jgi:hypothetical protein
MPNSGRRTELEHPRRQIRAADPLCALVAHPSLQPGDRGTVGQPQPRVLEDAVKRLIVPGGAQHVHVAEADVAAGTRAGPLGDQRGSVLQRAAETALGELRKPGAMRQLK